MNTNTATYSELKSFIKDNRTGNEDFFGDYTHQTTEGLRRLVDKFQRLQNSSNDLQPSVNVEPQQPKKSVESTNIHDVIHILVETCEKLKNLLSYAKEQEDKALHAKLMAFEAEVLASQE